MNLEQRLGEILAAFQCQTGTIHALDAAAQTLHLKAQRGVPPALLDKVAVIPVGKGMAGIAAERKEPVQVCNLQTDASGVAKPSAKLTQMAGSITVPILSAQGELCGTLGIATQNPHEFDADETKRLMAAARELTELDLLSPQASGAGSSIGAGGKA
jgi:putative methionine-R-sulfoxide reductase with GAF domain